MTRGGVPACASALRALRAPWRRSLPPRAELPPRLVGRDLARLRGHAGRTPGRVGRLDAPVRSAGRMLLPVDGERPPSELLREPDQRRPEPTVDEGDPS